MGFCYPCLVQPYSIISFTICVHPSLVCMYWRLKRSWMYQWWIKDSIWVVYVLYMHKQYSFLRKKIINHILINLDKLENTTCIWQRILAHTEFYQFTMYPIVSYLHGAYVFICILCIFFLSFPCCTYVLLFQNFPCRTSLSYHTCFRYLCLFITGMHVCTICALVHVFFL